VELDVTLTVELPSEFDKTSSTSSHWSIFFGKSNVEFEVNLKYRHFDFPASNTEIVTYDHNAQVSNANWY